MDSAEGVAVSSWTSEGKKRYLEEDEINVTSSAQFHHYLVKEMQHFPPSLVLIPSPVIPVNSPQATTT